jgi:signal transduction histidine kinase
VEPEEVTVGAATRTEPTEGPRLELDQLLAQLIDRAQDVQAAQNRLRGLLRANRAVIGDLALSTVLRRIVEAACELVNAPYGALGVIQPDGGGLEEFIHVGMEPHIVEKIGHLPEGKGLLGALIDDPRPIRLRDIRDDIRSVGFPEHHPPMTGFLGVPIRVRNEIFGNLYLASLTQGDFSAEDEELVSALAATAGVAIENARLFEESKHRQEWLEASTDVTRQLLTAQGDDALRLVAQRVADLAVADVVTVVLPTETGNELTVAVAVGAEAEKVTGFKYPIANTFTEEVLRSGVPAVIEDATDTPAHGERTVMLNQVLPVGPVMMLPLAGAQGVRGVLVVGRGRGRRAFTAADVDMATNFAYQASVALELADGRRDAQRMALFEDRARIARDLHDHVIQQLFASGMTLQGAAATMGDAPGVELIEKVVDNIDDAIRQIRTSIFQLRPHTMLGGRLRAGVLDVVAEVTPSLGSDPQVHFAGPVDAVSDEAMAAEVSAVVRESLTNVAKHAQAMRVGVTVAVAGASLTVTVEDDGVGLGKSTRRSGLENLRQRAEDRSGTFVMEPGENGCGTRVTWQVPTR